MSLCDALRFRKDLAQQPRFLPGLLPWGAVAPQVTRVGSPRPHHHTAGQGGRQGPRDARAPRRSCSGEPDAAGDRPHPLPAQAQVRDWRGRCHANPSGTRVPGPQTARQRSHFTANTRGSPVPAGREPAWGPAGLPAPRTSPGGSRWGLSRGCGRRGRLAVWRPPPSSLTWLQAARAPCGRETAPWHLGGGGPEGVPSASPTQASRGQLPAAAAAAAGGRARPRGRGGLLVT